MDILNTFGINWILLAAQIVNFLIIMYVLKRYAYKPVLKLLKERQDKIKEGLKQAEEARRLLEETEAKERKVLRDAQNEAKKLLEEAAKRRDELLAETEERTKQQADKILNDAREQITFETKEAERRLTSQISSLAIQLLEKSTADLLSKDDQEVILKNAVKKLKSKAN